MSAAIVADVKRFCHQIKTDEVFGTHTSVQPNCCQALQNEGELFVAAQSIETPLPA
jgi:hypothetical protein